MTKIKIDLPDPPDVLDWSWKQIAIAGCSIIAAGLKEIANAIEYHKEGP